MCGAACKAVEATTCKQHTHLVSLAARYEDEDWLVTPTSVVRHIQENSVCVDLRLALLLYPRDIQWPSCDSLTR